jgi:hypothetical protein
MDLPPLSGLAELKQLLVPILSGSAVERCGLCDAEVGGEHAHLVDAVSRSLVCVCRACHFLFVPNGAAQARFRLVPNRYLSMTEGEATQWEVLEIPVGVAFFFFNSALNRIAALYPSPAGATESSLPLEAWSDVVAAHPVLSSLAPDVEAWLVRRTRSARESFIVPIDVCYELVGIIRRDGKGFDGGGKARDAIDGFFARVRARCVEPAGGRQ